MSYLKTSLILFFIFFACSNLFSQFNGISGGLVFSTGVDYNTATTGNPGFYIRSYYKVNNRFVLLPELVAFKKYSQGSIFTQVLNNYMFHADFDGAYSLYREGALTFLGFAGVNATAIISRWDIPVRTAYTKDISDIKPGLNIGAAFHLYVNQSMDGFISAKYIVSSYSQAVINVGAIYYWGGKRRKVIW
jgi:hypothetical protein